MQIRNAKQNGPRRNIAPMRRTINLHKSNTCAHGLPTSASGLSRSIVSCAYDGGSIATGRDGFFLPCAGAPPLPAGASSSTKHGKVERRHAVPALRALPMVNGASGADRKWRASVGFAESMAEFRGVPNSPIFTLVSAENLLQSPQT
jgi:hypothetical protein